MIDRLVGDVVEQVEPSSTLLPSPGLKLLVKEFVKAKNRAISNDDVPESVKLVTDRVGDITSSFLSQISLDKPSLSLGSRIS